MNIQNIEEEKQLQAIFRITKEKAHFNPNRLTWCKQQDESLRKIVIKYNGHNWKKIGEEMKNLYPALPITGKKCRERWITSGKDGLNRLPLTNFEDLKLIIMHHKYNNKWAVISKQMPGRNPSCLKNNFYSLVKKLIRQIKLSKDISYVSPFKFFSTLYVIMFILEDYEPKNPEAYKAKGIPHIALYAKKQKISEGMCKTHFEKTKQGLITSANNFSSTAIENLKRLTFKGLQKFLEDMLDLIPQYLKAPTPDEAITCVIERLIGNHPHSSVPVDVNSMPLCNTQLMPKLPQIFNPLEFSRLPFLYPNIPPMMNSSIRGNYCLFGF